MCVYVCVCTDTTAAKTAAAFARAVSVRNSAVPVMTGDTMAGGEQLQEVAAAVVALRIDMELNVVMLNGDTIRLHLPGFSSSNKDASGIYSGSIIQLKHHIAVASANAALQHASWHSQQALLIITVHDRIQPNEDVSILIPSSFGIRGGG